MSTDVTVVGFDQNVPQWATEKTLDKLREDIQKSYGLDKEQNAILESTFEEIEKTRTLTNRYLSSINKTLGGTSVDTAITRAKREEVEVIRSATESTGGFKKGIIGAGDGMSYLVKNPMRLLGHKFTAIAGTIGVGVGVFGMFTKIVKDSIQTFTQTVDSFRTFNEIGITYQGTFLEYQKQLAESGISVSQMTELVNQYSRTVGTYGLKAIHSFSSAMEDGTFFFREYGLTQQEGIEYTTKYLERQRLMGLFHDRTEERHQQALRQNIKDLTAYSRIMNISREEIQKKQEQFFDRDDIRAYLASLEAGQREVVGESFDAVSKLLGTMGMDDFTDIVADALVKGSPMASEKFQELFRVAPNLGRELAGVIQEVQDGVIVDPSIVADRLFPAAQADRHIIQPLLTAGGELQAGAHMAGKFLYNLELYTTNYEKLQDEIEKRAGRESGLVNENVKAMAGLRQEMNKFMSQLEVSKVELFMKALGVEEGGATKAVQDITAQIENLSGYLRDDFKDSALAGLVGRLGEMTGSNIWKSFATLAIGVGFVSAAFQLLTKGLWRLTAWAIPGLLKMVGKGFVAATGGAALSGLGKVGLAARGGIVGAAGMGVGHLLARRFGEDTTAGALSKSAGNVVGAAGTGAMLGATLGPTGALVGAGLGAVGGTAYEVYRNRHRIYGTSPKQEEETPLRVQDRPEEITQTNMEDMINSMEDTDLEPVLQSIAMASNAQLEKITELVRLVRGGQTGLTGLS